MGNRIREYHRPKDSETASRLLEGGTGSRIVALVPRSKPSLDLYGEVETLVDLNHLGFAYIRRDGAIIHVGPMTTLQELAESPLIRSVADGILCEAAKFAAHLGLRNSATVQGALETHEHPEEYLLPFLVLDMNPVGWSHLLRDIEIPVRPAEHGAFVRIARTPRDIAIVSACAVMEVEGGACRQVRLAISCPKPKLITSVEGILSGKAFSPELLQPAAEMVMTEVEPENDFRASAEYRREMAGVLARRALEMAWKRATQ